MRQIVSLFIYEERLYCLLNANINLIRSFFYKILEKVYIATKEGVYAKRLFSMGVCDLRDDLQLSFCGVVCSNSSGFAVFGKPLNGLEAGGPGVLQ